MNVNVEINDVYIGWLNKKQATQIFFGGSSSGKSFFICQKIILDCIRGVNWLCCRNVARSIRSSIYNQIVKTTTLIISKKPGNTGISRDIRTEFTTDLLLSD